MDLKKSNPPSKQIIFIKKNCIAYNTIYIYSIYILYCILYNIHLRPAIAKTYCAVS